MHSVELTDQKQIYLFEAMGYSGMIGVHAGADCQIATVFDFSLLFEMESKAILRRKIGVRCPFDFKLLTAA